MTVASASQLLGAAEREQMASQYTSQSNDSLGKDAFLTLLVAQMEHQDPLNPVADTEFTSQLAQFSSLEQLTNISSGIETLNESSDNKSILDSVNFIDKEVRADGSSLSKQGEDISTVYYTIGDTATSMFINIFDEDNNLIRTDQFSAKQAGTYEYNWDGKSYTGADMPDGIYNVMMAAEGVNGQAVLVGTEVSGMVQGLQINNGYAYLRLDDGRQVAVSNISEVVGQTE